MRQVIDHDPQFGNPLRNLHDRVNQSRIGIGGLEHQARRGQRLQPIDKAWIFKVRRQIAVPEIPVANPQKQRVAMQPVKIGQVGRRTGHKVSHHAHNHPVVGGHIQQPLVVARQRTRLNGDGAHNAQRRGFGHITLRQRRFVDHGVSLLRPGNAAGPQRIEEMDVRINDRNGP